MLDTLRQTFTDNWIAWAYQYTLGGLFFWATLYLGVRSGAVDLTTRHGKRFVTALVLGLFLFAGAHFAWITAVEGPPGAIPQAEVVRRTEANQPGSLAPRR